LIIFSVCRISYEVFLLLVLEGFGCSNVSGIVVNEQLDKLAFSFFKLFAHYESSLKENDFFQVRNRKILVDWDRFANEAIGVDFMNGLGEKAEYAKFILDEPPNRQVVNDAGKIIWEEVSNQDKSVQSLFGHISAKNGQGEPPRAE
jgi:hypothetical protein